MKHEPTRTYMKRQHLDGYDLYTPQEKPENDGYITLLVIFGSILAVVAFFGADNVIEVLSEVISKW